MTWWVERAHAPHFTDITCRVGGRGAWYAQCGFESVAVSWLFPGRAPRIDALVIGLDG